MNNQDYFYSLETHFYDLIQPYYVEVVTPIHDDVLIECILLLKSIYR